MKISAILFALLFAFTSFATDKANPKETKSRPLLSNQSLKCKADDPQKEGSGVTFTLAAMGMANQLSGKAEFKGRKVSATWNKGDKHESQATFAMILDDYSSTIYDFSPEGHRGPINLVEVKGVRFQCWFE